MARPRETLSRMDGDSIAANRYSWPRYRTPKVDQDAGAADRPELDEPMPEDPPDDREFSRASI